MTATVVPPPQPTQTRRVVFPFTAIVGQEEMKLALLETSKMLVPLIDNLFSFAIAPHL